MLLRQGLWEGWVPGHGGGLRAARSGSWKDPVFLDAHIPSVPDCAQAVYQNLWLQPSRWATICGEKRCSGVPPSWLSSLSPGGEETRTLTTFSGSGVMQAERTAEPLWEMAQGRHHLQGLGHKARMRCTSEHHS